MTEKFIVRRFFPRNQKPMPFEDMEFFDLLEAVRYAANLPKTTSKFDEVCVFNEYNELIFVPKRKEYVNI